MAKKLTAFAAFAFLFLSLAGCRFLSGTDSVYTQYSASFFDCFDTLTQVVAQTKTEEEFNRYYNQIHARMQYLHKLFDIYNDYDGINNIKTINDNAGIRPVKVEKEIIDLLLFSKEWHKKTGGRMNVAFGSVLKIWHDYRTAGLTDPANALLPPMVLLQEAARHTDIDKVIIDEENSTVYLADRQMRLDVGGVAKGFAVEIAARESIDAGLTSGIIGAGGNIRTIGAPKDGRREKWSIGIQNPSQPLFSDDNLIETVYVADLSVVSSGDYQRYYYVNGKAYHHIIDPHTLMPAEYNRAVTVVVEDSGLADFMSTALFLMPFSEGLALAESIDGLEAMWVMKDGSVKTTEGLKPLMKSQGATNSVRKYNWERILRIFRE